MSGLTGYELELVEKAVWHLGRIAQALEDIAVVEAPVVTELVAEPAEDIRVIVRTAKAEAVDECCAIITQTIDTMRAEDPEGESRVIRAGIEARQHAVRMLKGYRDLVALGADRGGRIGG